MGDSSGHLDTDHTEATATVQRLQGMVQHLRTKHESEAATVAELRARVQNAEAAFEAAWNVIARLETDLAGLRRQTAIPPDDANPNEQPSIGRKDPSRFDEDDFFDVPTKRRDHAG